MAQYPLSCTRCGKEHPFAEPILRCQACSGALALPLIRVSATTQPLPTAQGRLGGQPLFARYRCFYPYFPDFDVPDLGEGFTPLLEMPELADDSGADVIYIKNESANPTWSFKDRGTAAGMRRALGLGYAAIGTVSSGNMGLSVAAYAARASLRAVVLVSEGIAAEKLSPIAQYGADVIKVRGDYAELYDASLEIGRAQGIYFINSDEPFRVEGYKTLAYELCEQLQYDLPEYVVVPTSAGGHFRGIWKGFLEMQAAGLITRLPRMVCAQAAGCAPIAEAFQNGWEEIRRVAHPQTIAAAIQNPYPPSGNAVLQILRAHAGLALAVTDEELLAAQRELSRRGLFLQPASAASYAAVRRMGQEGLFSGRERVVCIGTSAGFKAPGALAPQTSRIHSATLTGLEGLIAGLA